jgi:hypothetical protein
MLYSRKFLIRDEDKEGRNQFDSLGMRIDKERQRLIEEMHGYKYRDWRNILRFY